MSNQIDIAAKNPAGFKELRELARKVDKAKPAPDDVAATVDVVAVPDPNAS